MSDLGEKTSIIILAAGIGKRMKSDKPKVLHEICFKPVIYYILNAVLDINPLNVFVVVGYKGDMVKKYLDNNFPGVKSVYQQKQLGTADAVLTVKRYVKDMGKYCIVLTGDMPLITSEVLKKIARQKLNTGSGMIAVSAILENPFGYGRIIRDRNGGLVKIVEESDATQEQKKVTEINSSIYCFDTSLLFDYLQNIKPQNKQNELYLTDIVEKFLQGQNRAEIFTLEDSSMSEGFNDMVQLSNIEKSIQMRINTGHMLSGIRIKDPLAAYIDPETKIGAGTVIEPFSFLKGSNEIGKNCVIGPFTQISCSQINDNSVINKSVVINSIVKSNSVIGPDSHIKNLK